jgi:hypothetical protein
LGAADLSLSCRAISAFSLLHGFGMSDNQHVLSKSYQRNPLKIPSKIKPKKPKATLQNWLSKPPAGRKPNISKPGIKMHNQYEGARLQ